MADRLAHIPDLAVPSFVNRDPQRRVISVALAGQQFDVRRLRASTLDDDAS
jgi:hypothetical protein